MIRVIFGIFSAFSGACADELVMESSVVDGDESFLDVGMQGADDTISQMDSYTNNLQSGYHATGAGGSAQGIADSRGTNAVNTAMSAATRESIDGAQKEINSLLDKLKTCAAETSELGVQSKKLDTTIKNGLKSFQDSVTAMQEMGGQDEAILNMVSIIIAVNDYIKTKGFDKQFNSDAVSQSMDVFKACEEYAGQGTSCQNVGFKSQAAAKAECSPDAAKDISSSGCKTSSSSSSSSSSSFMESVSTGNSSSTDNSEQQKKNKKGIDNSHTVTSCVHRDDYIMCAIKSGAGQCEKGSLETCGRSHMSGLHSVIMLALLPLMASIFLF